MRIPSGDEAAWSPVPAADGRIACERYERGVGGNVWVMNGVES